MAALEPGISLFVIKPWKIPKTYSKGFLIMVERILRACPARDISREI
jgi:hypothetical protein